MNAGLVPQSRLGWLVNDFADRVSGVAHVVVTSADGVLLTHSERLPEGKADQLSAIVAGLSSLTDGAARCFDGGEVVQTIVEMEAGVVLVMSIGDGSKLSVLASPLCDIGLIGYEMTLLVSQVGAALTPDARHVPEHYGNR
ncbi:roadblock/LC7 domain-containing protein [Amycolatopsis sp. NPDC004378]